MGVETVIFIALAAAAAGTAAYSSYRQGKAAEKQGEYNAKVARINQKTSQEQADSDLTRVREKYRRVHASQTADAAANGLTLSDSAYGEIWQDTNLQEDLDSLNLLYKSKVDITGQEQRAGLALMQGAQGREAGNIGAVSSIISGAAGAYGDYPTIAN